MALALHSAAAMRHARIFRWGTRLAIAAMLSTLAVRGHAESERDDDNFREDVIGCEEAVAHLARCCPGFDAAAIDCRYHYARTEGCDGSRVDAQRPALPPKESACIRASSCSVLVARGVCERAQRAKPYVERWATGSYHVDDAGVSSHRSVCP